MNQILRLWWPLFAAVTLIQTGNGITGTLVSVTSEAAGFAPWLQGLVLSAFYGGSLGGALLAPAAIARSSHVTSFVGFTLLLVACTAGFALTSDALLWVALRFAAGFGISGMFTTVESWLNLGTQDGWRARVFSVYLMTQLFGLVAGQLFLNARGLGNEVLFLAAAAFQVVALMCLRFETVQNPTYESTTRRIALVEIARRAPLGIACVVLSGLAWAGLMASGPALVELIGLGDFEKSMFMALAIAAGMASQIPVGWAADHADRRLVLAVITAVAGCAALLGLAGQSVWVLLAFAALFGAATFPLYAVGVARVNDTLHQSERTTASAAMIVFFQAGAIVTPPALSFATASTGAQGYFVVLALPHLLFAAACVLAMRSPARRPDAAP